MGYIRDVYSDGAWFSIQGPKKHVNKLSEEEITTLCQKTLSEGICVDKDLHVKVTKSGRRSYVHDSYGSLPAKKTTTCFQKFAYIQALFLRFFSFITGRSRSKEQDLKLQIQFAMQLFKSEDDELLEQMFPSDSARSSSGISDFSFSSVLHHWVESLRGIDPKNEKLEPLERLLEYQKDIEDICTTRFAKRRASLRKKLNEKLVRAVQNAGEGVSIYMPGGTSTERSRPMVYELKKEGGELIINAFDISGRYFYRETKGESVRQTIQQEHLCRVAGEKEEEEPVFCAQTESRRPLDKLDDFVSRAVYFLSEDVTRDDLKTRLREKIEKKFEQKFTKFFDGEDLCEKPKEEMADDVIIQDHTLMSLVGHEASPSSAKYRQSRKLPGDYTKAFLRMADEEGYRLTKVRIRARALFSMWDGSGELIADRQFRGWLSENAITLLKGLEKGFSASEGDQIRKDLELIIGEIEEYDAHQGMKIGNSEKEGTSFDEPLRPATTPIRMNKIFKRSICPDLFGSPVNMDEILEKRDIQKLEGHIASLKKLTNKRKFSEVHFYVKEVFCGLERCSDEQWSEIANSDEFERWSNVILELSFLLPRVSFGAGRISPLSEDIKMYLQSMRFQDLLIRKREHLSGDPYNQEFALDMDPVEGTLKNPYIQLGDDAQAIYDQIAYFRSLDKRPFRGVTVISGRSSTYHQGPEESLYSRYGLSDIYEGSMDIGQKGILPQYIVNLRKSYCVLGALLAPTQALLPASITKMAFLALKSLLKKNPEESCFLAFRKYIENRMTSRLGEISFRLEKMSSKLIEGHGSVDEELKKGFFVVIEPWGLFPSSFGGAPFLNMDRRFHEKGKFKASMYFDKGQHFDCNGISITDPLLREKGFEQVVSSFYDENYFFSDSGDPQSRNEDTLYSMRGRTEWQILQDQSQIFGLPSQTFQQLQLMKTSSKSIVENTLTFVAQNQELLDQENYGFQVARLIERNFFRNNAFGNKSFEEQQFAFDQISRQLMRAKLVGNDFAFLHLFEIARKMYVNAREGAIEREKFEVLIAALKEQEIRCKERGCWREYVGARLTVHTMTNTFLLEEFLPLYFQYVSVDALHERRDLTQENRFREMLMRHTPSLKEKMRRESERTALCNGVARALGLEVSEGEWTSDSSGLLVSQGRYTLDFSRCEVWEKNKRVGQLPPTIIESAHFPAFERLLSQDIPGAKVRELIWAITPVEIPTTELPGQSTCEALQYESKVGTRLFRIVSGSDGSLRLYRKDTNNAWYMYQEDIFSETPSLIGAKDAPPRAALMGDCWVQDDGKQMIIEREGQKEWVAHLSGKAQVRSLKRVTDERSALNIAGKKEAGRFFALEDGPHVTALGKNRVIDRVEYGRFTYTLQQAGNRWVWEKNPEYFLSDHSLESYAHSPKYSEDVSQNGEVKEGLVRLENLFHPSFSNYHLLEHDKEPPKLVLPGVPFSKKEEHGDRSYQFTPDWRSNDVDTVALYEFDVDPIKGLIPKVQPEGYIYLSYVLAIQGNVKDALYYFQKSSLNRPLSPQGQEIFSWLELELKESSEASLDKALLDACLFLAKPEIDPFGKEGQIRALQAKIKYDALSAAGGSNTQAASALRQIAHGSWVSAVYELSKDPSKKDLVNNALSILDIVFEEDQYTELDNALLDAHHFISNLKSQGVEVDIYSKERETQAFQAKTKYDALSAAGGSETQAALVLYLIAERYWIESMYDELSKDPSKRGCIDRKILDALDVDIEEGRCIARGVKDLPCCEETKRWLREFISKRPSDPGAFIESGKNFLLLKEWREFDEQVLLPLNVGEQELKTLRDEGGFEKLRKINEASDLFDSKTMEHLIDLSRIREAFVLKNKIEELEKTIEDRKREPTERAPGEERAVSLFAAEEKAAWQDCFSEQTVSASALTVADVERPELNGTSEYANELQTELHADFCSFVADSPHVSLETREHAAEQVGKKSSAESFSRRVVTKGGALHNTLVQVEQEKTKEAQRARKRCLSFLQPQAQRSLVDRFKRVGRATPDMLFDTAVRCYGEGSWEPLRSLLEPDADVGLLGQDIADFLKASIQAKQIQTARMLAESLPQDENDPKFVQTSNEIASLLNTNWSYDVDTDPLAPTLLLTEYELGFVCRPSQLLVVRENLGKENQFKQEICGGGKTTVLRNIISQFRADGKTLSGVSTLEPLRAEHGLLLARTTKNAYEEQVFEFRFERTSPTDERSLRCLYRDLLETTVNRGRIDLTKGDLQSFKLAMLLKQEEIALLRNGGDPEAEKKVAALHNELDRMEDVRDFLYEHAVIMADELDKDCDPTQEKNYAHGDAVKIVEEERSAACLIIKKICAGTSERLTALSEAFLENRQSRLDEGVRVAALKELAVDLYAHFRGELSGVSQESFVAYLTDPDSEEAERVYRALFEDKELSLQLREVAFCRRLLSEIVPHALKKRAGISYGRSKRDGVSVIPYAGSDRPKEGSLHANETERVWYTCADYLQNGLSKDQARALWIQAKQKAVKQALMANYEDPSRAVFLDDMPAAIEFAEKFLSFGDDTLTLSKVQECHVDEIVKKINGDTPRKIEFVETTILPSLRQEEEKIVSDAQDLPHMVKSYSGSSGTDTGMHALPDKIVIEGARQEGVHGRVLAALRESEKKLGRDSFVSYEDERELIQLLAEEMEGGDCLVDVGRLFPGVAPKDIAKAMSEGARQKGVEYIVFTDSEDRWKMLRTDNGEEVDYLSSGDLKKRITIFDDVRTRGAERDSTEGVVEFVTLDVDTDWSGFEQGVARERNLLKGKADVRYILSPQLRSRLGEKISLDSLIELLAKNEAEKLQMLNYKAELQRIRHVLRRTGEKSLRAMSSADRKAFSSNHHSVREYLFRLERDLFFCKTGVDAQMAACPQKEQLSSSVLDSVVSKQLHMLDSMKRDMETAFEGAPLMEVAAATLEEARPLLWAKYSEEARRHVPRELEAQVHALCESGKGRVSSKYLPVAIPGGSSVLDNETETEQEIEAEQEQEQEQEVVSIREGAEKEKDFCRSPLTFSYSPKKGLIIENYIKLDFLSDSIIKTVTHHPLNNFFPFGQEGKVCTENCFPVSRSKEKLCPWGLKDGEIILPPAQKRIERSLFVIEEDGRVKEFWGGQLDLDREFLEIVQQKEDPYRSFIFNYGLGTVDTGCGIEEFGEETQHKIMEYIAATKLHRGDTDFVRGNAITTNLYDPLVRFLRTQQDLSLLKRGVRAAIAAYRPDVSYEGSSLSRAFREAAS